jgi:hypothetical protein
MARLLLDIATDFEDKDQLNILLNFMQLPLILLLQILLLIDIVIT